MATARPMIGIAALALALCGATLAAAAQTVATGAGRSDELNEAARIDAYLADASRAGPTSQAESRVTASEAAASAGAMPPMDPDGSWARGVSGPTAHASAFAAAQGPEGPCDHKMHGEVGAEVGTGGTRGGYGVVTAPLGKDCQAHVTVGVSSYRGRDYGGYGGYGYGGGFGYGAGSRTQNAFSLGFSAGDRRAPGDPPAF